MSQGQWVTLHFIQPMPLEDGSTVHKLTGYMEPDARLSGYRLTKLATKARAHSGEHIRDGGQWALGTQTTIHQGLWLISPQVVWMVEYEQEAPVEGFIPED